MYSTGENINKHKATHTNILKHTHTPTVKNLHLRFISSVMTELQM